MVGVRTINGDVTPDALGITLIHEHPFMDASKDWDADHCLMDFATQAAELSIFRSQGGTCVVDQTNIGMGRQPDLLKQLADETGLHVVAATGFYREPWLPETVREAEIDALAQIMVREVRDHIEGADFRAGIIGEIGSTEFGTTPLEEKVLRAAARAHLVTGAPISTHTMGGAEALRQIAILREEGVDPRRVIVSHLDLDHVEHLRMVAELGVFLGFDTIGKSRYREDQARLDVLLAMVHLGFEDQIVLSHDISRASYLRLNGGHGYGHLLGNFVPRLRQGLPEAVVDKFLIDNPRRALAF